MPLILFLDVSLQLVPILDYLFSSRQYVSVICFANKYLFSGLLLRFAQNYPIGYCKALVSPTTLNGKYS